MNSKRRVWSIPIAAFLLLAVGTHAQVPQLINYQGQLTDANGNPANGNFSIVFAIYSSATGGTALYSETQNVAVSSGVFNVLIGSVNPVPLNLFDSGPDRYLEITVNNTVLTPRRRFGSVPYAFTSRGGSGDITSVNAGAGLTGGGVTGDVTLAVANDGINSAMIQDNTIVNADVNTNAAIAGTKITPNFGAQNILTTGRAGIGTTNPAAAVHTVGTGTGQSGDIRLNNGAVQTHLASDATQLFGQVGTQSNHGFNIVTNNLSKMFITNTGNVGIGTTNPQAPLQITGAGNRFIDISSTDAIGSLTRLMAVTSNGIAESQLQFKNRLGFVAPLNGTFRMTLLENGNVGIGTSTPTQMLDVAGNVRAKGFTQSGNGGETLRIIRGRVNTGGVGFGGTGFTSSRTGTGTYSISFLTSFGDPPAVVVSPRSTLVAIATVDATTASSCIVRMFDTNGAPADQGFNFIAIGIP